MSVLSDCKNSLQKRRKGRKTPKIACMLTLCTQPPAPISKVKEIETRPFKHTWEPMESLCQFCPIAKISSRSRERVETPKITCMLTLCTHPPAPISKVKEIETRPFRHTWGPTESLCQFCPIAKIPSRSWEKAEKALKLRAKCSHANTLHATDMNISGMGPKHAKSV